MIRRVTLTTAVRAFSTRSDELPTFALNNLGGLQRRDRKRRGRGQGSGLGKTAGRGHKGQKARSGGGAGPYPGFEGGQTPLFKRVAKRGFKNTRFATRPAELRLSELQRAIDLGRLDTSKPVTQRELMLAGLVKRNAAIVHGVKLIGDRANMPTLESPLTIELASATKGAEDAVVRAGGRVVRVYHNRLGMRAHLLPHKFDRLPQPATVPPAMRAKGFVHPHEAPSFQLRQEQQQQQQQRTESEEST